MLEKLGLNKIKNLTLQRQLVLVTLVALVMSFISFGIILPNVIKPFYEENIYEYLEQPVNYIKISNNRVGENVAYIIVTKSGAIYTSNNMQEIFDVNMTTEELLKKIEGDRGKFNFMGDTYYYMHASMDTYDNYVFTNDSMIEEQEKSLSAIIMPTMIVTILITTALTYAWSSHVVSKIKRLKHKTELIISDEYKEEEFLLDDELNMLNKSIDETRKSLKTKEEYKNYMFQNMSHELKTPISVIDSYIEAVQDGVVESTEGMKIIKEETNELMEQVNTILKFNKIDYMKEQKEYSNQKINIVDVVTKSVEKHRLQTKNINWEVIINNKKKDILYKGTEDMWEMVIDNILGNFVRYAKSEIKIVVNSKQLSLYNDGEKIPEEMLKEIFNPFTKGDKGLTGLGLSIAKRTANLFGYDIYARNRDTGVIFVVEEVSKKS